MSEIIRYKPSEMAEAILGLDTSSILLRSIEITKPPNKTEYKPSESFDPTGMYIEGKYSNNLLKNVTQNCTFNPTSFVNKPSGSVEVQASYTEKNITKYDSINVIINDSYIYGVECDGFSSTALTRTDDAKNFSNPNPYYSGMSGTPTSPFDSISPWCDMVVSERTGGTVVSIPKFYYKWEVNGTKIKLQIMPGQYSQQAIQKGFHCSPAHMDRGDGKGERDIIYVGRYFCDENNYKSTTGIKPKTNISYNTILTTSIDPHNLGNNIWLMDYATYTTIRMLYLVEFADWDSQNKIGYGCGDGSISVMGYTDSMPYHTGTTQTSRTTYGSGIQYRNIEGLWDNVMSYLGGIYFNTDNIYILLNPSVTNLNNGVLVGQKSSSAGVPSAFAVSDVENYEWVLYPISTSGSNFPDYYSRGSGTGLIERTGGAYNSKTTFGGLFCMYTGISYTSASSTAGYRLMELP